MISWCNSLYLELLLEFVWGIYKFWVLDDFMVVEVVNVCYFWLDIICYLWICCFEIKEMSNV